MSPSDALVPRRFFTADHHFGHDAILRYCRETRPYADVAAMNEAFVDRWNATVQPEDEVWHLGDVSMKVSFVEEWIPYLNGRKHLVLGNHDTNGKAMTEVRRERYLAAGFETIAEKAVLDLNGVRFALCHYPYRVPERYQSNDPIVRADELRSAERALVSGKHSEAALLHGHIHQHWLARKQPGRLPELNVGVDAWFGEPVSVERLLSLLTDVQRLGQDGTMSVYRQWSNQP